VAQRHEERGTVKPGKKTGERFFEAGRAILRGGVYQKGRFDVKKYFRAVLARCGSDQTAPVLYLIGVVDIGFG